MKFDAAPAPQADALDSAAFQRVWDRVTAGQEHSPITPAPVQPPPPAPTAGDELALWMDRLAGAIRDDRLLARRWPGYSDAVMKMAESNVEALLAGEELPGGEGVADPSCLAMTTESLTREYPLYTPSLLNLVKTSETRARELTGEDRT